MKWWIIGAGVAVAVLVGFMCATGAYGVAAATSATARALGAAMRHRAGAERARTGRLAAEVDAARLAIVAKANDAAARLESQRAESWDTEHAAQDRPRSDAARRARARAALKALQARGRHD